MNNKFDFGTIPTIGWIAIIIIGIVLAIVLLFALYVISKKNVKS